MNVIEVGEPYNGPVPSNDGLHFEIGPDGNMILLIQFQKPDEVEKKALAAGFSSYSFYESGSLPLVCLVFKFPAPVMYMDAPFHAGLYTDGRIEKMMASDANTLEVIILDGKIVQGIRLVGLHPKVIDMLTKTVGKQLTAPISRAVYDSAVNDLFELKSKEIYERGAIFSHRETKQ